MKTRRRFTAQVKAKVAKLHAKIGQLVVERDFLAKACIATVYPYVKFRPW